MTEIRISPFSETVGAGLTAQFYATGYDSGGRPITISPTWSVWGGVGTVDATGKFYAGASTGIGYVIATASGISGQAQVTVTDKGSISGKVRNVLTELLSGITVRIVTDHSKSAQTNSSGSYILSDLLPATYQVETVGTTRYGSSSGEATVYTGQGSTLNFTLSERIGIQTDSINRTGTTMNINGTVRNNGSTSATGCTVFYFFYNAEDFPMGSGSSSLGTIAAGSTEAFIMVVNLSEDADPSRTVKYGIAGGF
ncbi:MAG: carboxypeptidase-like regulatory domain-containing protein [Candidatus Saganbacteria bacterium]|nr:carboxypeptidase-like regulatory domain-containing protein [Candidatus Saganbacteria bacterium]